jgi:hypothetical protein
VAANRCEVVLLRVDQNELPECARCQDGAALAARETFEDRARLGDLGVASLCKLSRKRESEARVLGRVLAHLTEQGHGLVRW